MSLKKNVISNFILTASTIVLPLITFPYVTRTLSSKALGDVFFIDAFTQYFILLSSLGIPYYGIREIAKNRKDGIAMSQLVLELVILQLSLSICCVALFYSLHLFIPKLSNSVDLIKIGALMIISNSLSIEWFFQGIENFSYITIRSLLLKVLSVFAIIVFVKHLNDSHIYYLILALLVLCNAVLNSFVFFKNYFIKFSFNKNIFRHLRPLLVLFSINASVSIYVILDSIILGFLTDTVNVSYYNIPLKLVKVYWLIIAGIGTVFIPRISALHASNEYNSISTLITKSVNIVLLLSIPFCFFCLVFPDDILTLISGKQYLPAKHALQILSVIPLIIGICNIFGTQFLLPIGKEKYILHATIVGLLVSLALNFILIPNFKFIGSAIAAVAAELSVCIYIFIAAEKNIKIILDFGLMLQILISLFITTIYYVLMHTYVNGLNQIIATGFVYVLSIIVPQLYFRNEFLYSLIKIGRKN